MNMSLIANAAEIIKSEGFTGPHSLVFLTRYAALTGDKALMRLLGNTLEDMSTMQESATLAYAYAEYFQATGEAGPEFCFPAADYILNSCDGDDRMLAAACAKVARVFGREAYLEKALDLLSDTETTAVNGAFSALAFTELYRGTFNKKYLHAAESMAEIIEKNFRSMFSPEDAYDLACPSMNSAVAVMYDELARITQKEELVRARKVQNSFIAKLADKYPSKVGFGLCALLADEFEPKTVVCRFPGEEIPAPLLSLIRFYSPVTEIVAEGGSADQQPRYFFLKSGKLEEIPGM